jgi:trehalose 6-phosphate phosphatase
MKYLWNNLSSIKRWIGNKPIFLFLDYDGTLTPIVQRPQGAALSMEARKLLRTLSKSDRCELAIISGRALSDVKKLVGLKNIAYVGNHGMEIKCPNLNFRHSVPTGYKNDLKQISTILHQALAGTDGVIIEDKGYSISLHYRLVDPKIIPLVKGSFEKVVSTYVQRKRIAVREGKMVLEVRLPLDWDKGKAVLWLLEKKHTSHINADTLPIYIGDDLTDEDAFVLLKDRGITVVVGKQKESEAQYYLNDTAEVVEFLRQISEMVRT